MSKIKIAHQFGIALDKDDYQLVLSLLADECIYDIGSSQLLGPNDICNSYKQNMLDGKKKMDSLKWGDSQIEQIDEDHFYVHFTDYLMHKGLKYTHRCKQYLTVDENLKIIRIDHIYNKAEMENLNAFYISVGIPTNSIL